MAIEQTRTRGSWEVGEVALREVTSRSPFSRGHVVVVDWDEVPDFFVDSGQGTDQVLAQLSEMKPADVARELHEMSPERRAEVVEALDDDVLAEALEELPEAEQVRVIQALDTERAADILEEMDPDDAADLIAELAPELAETLLERMEPEEAEDVRLLLNYDAATAGGLMTPEPVVLGPDATVADCLALLRNEEVTPALAALAFLCRPPLDTPTGPLPGGGPHPAAAARTAVRAGRRPGGQHDRAPAPAPRRRPGEPLLRDLRPGVRARGQRRRPARRRGHRRRRARPHPPRRLARHPARARGERWLSVRPTA